MVREILVSNKKVFIIDYSNQKEAEMIADVLDLKERIIKQSSPALIMTIFNDKSYATPKFMRTVEQTTREVERLLGKQAIVGLNQPKKLILKGYNLLFRKSIRDFDSQEEAMRFLLDDLSTNNP